MNKIQITDQLKIVIDLLSTNLVNSKTVLTLKETAVFLDIKEGTLYHLTSQKLIPFYKRSHKLYFKKSELETWMLQNRQLTTDELKTKAIEFIEQNPTLKAKRTWNKVNQN